jgi:hypothetical protein
MKMRGKATRVFSQILSYLPVVTLNIKNAVGRRICNARTGTWLASVTPRRLQGSGAP